MTVAGLSTTVDPPCKEVVLCVRLPVTVTGKHCPVAVTEAPAMPLIVMLPVPEATVTDEGDDALPTMAIVVADIGTAALVCVMVIVLACELGMLIDTPPRAVGEKRRVEETSVTPETVNGTTAEQFDQTVEKVI